MKTAGFLLLFLLAFPATGQNDPARGRLLYDTYCGACHYERVHQRLRTKIGDLGDLRDEVGRWSRETKRAWTLDELEDVVQYLNESHYRIGLPPKGEGGLLPKEGRK